MGRNNVSQRAHAHVLAACRAYDLTVAAFASQQASCESGESCSSNSTDVNALLRELQAELGISAKDAKAIDESFKQRSEEQADTDMEEDEEEDESGSCTERSDAQWIEVSLLMVKHNANMLANTLTHATLLVGAVVALCRITTACVMCAQEQVAV
jgi:hypothetical protein